MNHKFGLKLNRFIVSNTKEIREIELLDGLNVISGPTDTGKTYIYQCIKYLLGSNSVPKLIPENIDFKDAYLEVHSLYNDTVFTLKRTFSSNKIYIYDCAFNELTENTKGITANTQGSKNLISTKILEYGGLEPNIKIKTHIRQQKFRKIALRDFLHFSLVDEKEIITDTSLLTTGQYVSKTVELNLFYYFISGKYTSFQTFLSDQKASKNDKKEVRAVEGKSDNLIVELIEETKSELISLEKAELENEVSYKDELLFVTTEIEKQSNQLKQTFENIEKLKSKKLMNHELIIRFNLLKDQFNSDLQRLEFILEGGEILSKLTVENCPTCGKKLDDQSHKGHINSRDKGNIINAESLFSSYNSEKKKILLNFNDLSKTIKNLESKNHNIYNEIITEEKEYQQVKQQIDNELKPTQNSLKEKINKEVQARLIKAKIDFLKNKLFRFETQRQATIPTYNPAEEAINFTDNIKKLIDINIGHLSDLMNTYLLNMKFPEVQVGSKNVIFDPKTNDFIVNGKARSVYGKGYRAIIYSVFLISLMKLCKEKNLPHIGFVIIDSPLTTYQAAEEVVKEEEKIPDELKGRFINTFASEKDSQIIILENKFPMEMKDINFIEFTRDRNKGRYGFI
ncbi:AAA family ATPase [Peribacillus simplex]|uniref:AAA family ATPase n=1 Tax=Peribacillus simplex TaxID=1478 RepID=UPI0011DD3FD1|nr:AAA family ATPase [Peribacillus simplex]